MINQLLNIFFLALPFVYQALEMDRMLDVDEAKASRKVRVLVWGLLMVPGVCIRVFVNNYDVTKNFTLIHGVAAYFVYFKLFYTDVLWRKVVVFVAIFFGTSLAEVGLLFTLPRSGLDSITAWDFKRSEIVVISAIGALFSILGVWFVSLIWEKVVYRGKRMRHTWLFVLFASSQMVSFFLLPYLYMNGVMNSSIYYSLLLSLLCSMGLVFLIYNQSEKEDVEIDLKETSQEKQLENEHFTEIVRKRNELKQMVEDNKFLVNKVEVLLEENHVEEAKERLMYFLERLDMTREYPYCSIPIVNVILTEKVKEMKTYGIAADIGLNIWNEIEVKQVDLCSAFSNILDNAIRACKQMNDSDTYIKLRSKCIGEYFIIKCENSYRKGMGPFVEGSGYGLKILKDIARRYHGNFQVNEKENEFMVQLSLRL